MLIALCAPNAGPLLVPVIVYGLALVTSAVLATGFSTIAGIGGAIFFVSDGLIALRSFAGITLPQHGFLVMLTYITAQVLIAYAVVSHQTRPPQRSTKTS